MGIPFHPASTLAGPTGMAQNLAHSPLPGPVTRAAQGASTMLTYLVPIVGNLILWLWLAIGVACWRWTTGKPKARRLALAGFAALWLLACPAISRWVAWPLESRFERPSVESLRERGVRQVVILTGGGLVSTGDHLAGALPDASAHRFLAGLELARRLDPDCRLIFSGAAGRGRGDVATADSMARLARLLAPDQPQVSESRSLSTAEHPANVGPLLDGGVFALVTSAYHMPRAMRSFRRAGWDPIAFPVERRSAQHFGANAAHWTDWLPSIHGLRTQAAIWREILALGLYVVRGW